MLLQDESCIAAHLGERAPKGAEDESATQEQQDDIEQGKDPDDAVDGTGGTTALSSKVCMVYLMSSAGGAHRLLCSGRHTATSVWCVQHTCEMTCCARRMLSFSLTSRTCYPLTANLGFP